jgi:photosystem II stability/assembly factor-like uncharacterized protein
MEMKVFVGAAFWDQARQGAQTAGLFSLAESGEWRHVTEGLPDEVEVRCIAMREPETIHVGTQHGPYRSDDGGRSWRAMELPGIERLVWSILPCDGGIIYVGTQGTSIYRSDDDGESWRQLSVAAPGGMVKMGFPPRVIRLAVDPSEPDTVYAGFEVGGIARSLDGGETWADCGAGLLELSKEDRFKSQLLSDTDTEGMMDSHAVIVSRSAPGSVILANRMGLFRSSDRGETWRPIEIGRFSDLTYARDVMVSPHDPDTLLAALSESSRGVAGSLYRSGDLGETWERFDHGVSIDSTLMTVAASARTPERVYCAARRGQVFGTEDGGASWRAYPLPDGVEGVYAIACA